MLTGVMVMPQLVAVRPVGFRPTPYDWVPLAVLILLIVIFVWVYSGRGRSRGRTAHRSGRRTVRRASRVPGRGGNHGHQAVSRRRPNRP
jgi:hypothetical protein